MAVPLKPWLISNSQGTGQSQALQSIQLVDPASDRTGGPFSQPTFTTTGAISTRSTSVVSTVNNATSSNVVGNCQAYSAVEQCTASSISSAESSLSSSSNPIFRRDIRPPYLPYGGGSPGYTNYESYGRYYGTGYGYRARAYGSPFGYDGYSYGRHSGYGLPDDSWFGRTAESLGQFSQILDMNTWFLDQICDTSCALTYRVRNIGYSMGEWIGNWRLERLLPFSTTEAQSGLARQGEKHITSSEPSMKSGLPDHSIEEVNLMENELVPSNILTAHDHCDSLRGQIQSRLRHTTTKLRFYAVLVALFWIIGLWKLYLLWRRYSRIRRESHLTLWDSIFRPNSGTPGVLLYRRSELSHLHPWVSE